MSYVLKGNLCGFVCDECQEPLGGLTVRLYPSRHAEAVAAAAVANAKDTFVLLSDEEASTKTGGLLGEGVIDEAGNFAVEIVAEGYAGEAFDVDIYCGTVPHRRPTRKPPAPLQFSLTTLAPQWRGEEGAFTAAWSYCIPSRLWCAVRARFGAWVICGRVVTCDTGVPLAGVTVSAFDADWLQDDSLGSAVTAGDGRFRIDYLTADFEKTPFSPVLNVELTPGPDLYFRIVSAGGTVLLDEHQVQGRAAGRENVGHCFCVELCAEEEAPPFDSPWFTHIGDFDVLADISTASGLTTVSRFGHGGPGFGFTGNLKLKGFCPKTRAGSPGLAMRYRFLFVHPATPGTEVPITGPSLVAPVVVGARLIKWDQFGTGLAWTPQTIVVAGSGATPDPTPTPVVPPGTPWGSVPDHVIAPDADGWVAVDKNALDDGFYGPLVRLVSAAAVPGGSPLDPGDGAGVAPVGAKNGVAVKLIFEARPINAAEPLTARQEVPKVLLNNWGREQLLDLTEFHGPGATGCTPLTSSLDIAFSVDQELLANYDVSVTSAAFGLGPPPNPSPIRAGTGPRGHVETVPVNIAAWRACSYTVSLSARSSLTDGETDDSGSTVSVTFCK